jgi:hypothetical protein
MNETEYDVLGRKSMLYGILPPNSIFKHVVVIDEPITDINTINQIGSNMKAEIQSKLNQLKEQNSLLEQQIKELEFELAKPDEWEPKGGNYIINGDGYIETAGGCRDSYRSFGTTRSSKEQATVARDEIRAFSRLLAYRDEFCPNWNEDTHHWVLSYTGNRWEVLYSVRSNLPCTGKVFFTETVAYELVKKLNSGEVKL